MKLSKISAMLVALCVWHITGYARVSPTGVRALTAELNQLTLPLESNATIGIEVKSMKYGDLLYIHHASDSLAPASISKILTAEAGLLYLGPEFRFTTTLMTDRATIEHGVLLGNLYLIHSGDPTLTYTDLVNLVSTLKSRGIDRIAGNVYIDNSAYDHDLFGPGWIWNDTRYCYAAPISASIINHNCLSFKIAPAKSKGQYASLIGDSRYYAGVIENTVVTESPHTRSCSLHVSKSMDRAVAISGCLPKGHRALDVTTTVNDVFQYNQSLLQSLLARYDIHISGSVRAGSAPPGLSLLAVHSSKPLSVLIRTMLKKSDNVIAGSLFKKIGAVYSREPGSWENGSRAVRSILSQHIGSNLSSIHLVDGSGLSPDNRIQPEQMMQILNFIFHDPQTNYDLISALPIAGIDGTLKYRLHSVARKVRAKTGTTADSGVISLAGYLITREQEPIAFVIMINGEKRKLWKYRTLEDDIVTALVNFRRTR